MKKEIKGGEREEEREARIKKERKGGERVEREEMRETVREG
jgi:hypothetical protein